MKRWIWLVILSAVSVEGQVWNPTNGSASAPSVTVSTSGPVTVSATGFYLNNAVGALTYNLPTISSGAVGSQYCFSNYVGKSGVITLQAPASTFIGVNGVNGSAAGTLVSGGALGDYACVTATTTTQYSATLVAGAWNGSTPTTTTIASGQLALATSAIASAACQTITDGTVNSSAATGVVATDTVYFTPNASIKAVTGYTPGTAGGLTIAAVPKSGFVGFDVCNWSANPITPGAVTINWRVSR